MYTYIYSTQNRPQTIKSLRCVLAIIFSDDRPRLLLEDIYEVTGPVSFSVPRPLSTGSSYSCPVQLDLSCLPYWPLCVVLMALTQHSWQNSMPGTDHQYVGKDGGVLEQTGRACRWEEQAGGGR